MTASEKLLSICAPPPIPKVWHTWRPKQAHASFLAVSRVPLLAPLGKQELIAVNVSGRRQFVRTESGIIHIGTSFATNWAFLVMLTHSVPKMVPTMYCNWNRCRLWTVCVPSSVLPTYWSSVGHIPRNFPCFPFMWGSGASETNCRSTSSADTI